MFSHFAWVYGANVRNNLLVIAHYHSKLYLCRERFGVDNRTFAKILTPTGAFAENFMIYRFDTLTSTNDEARNPRYKHGDIIVADYQTAGRGQRGNSWSSNAGQNLMFSIVLQPEKLRASHQFSMLECVALALTDTFEVFGIATTIKWTNDIYVGDRKMVGVLIENSLTDGYVSRSIVGIGINVNQTEFDPSLPNPTSMAAECGQTFACDEVLNKFYECLTLRLKSLNTEDIHNEYCSRLYRKGVEAEYALPDGTRFRGRICDVEPTGALLVDTAEGVRRFLFKEVAFVI